MVLGICFVNIQREYIARCCYSRNKVEPIGNNNSNSVYRRLLLIEKVATNITGGIKRCRISQLQQLLAVAKESK